MTASAPTGTAARAAVATSAVAAEWADVASALHTAPPVAPQPRPAGARPSANLALVMRSPNSRRDLRRILMVIGAIGRPRSDTQRAGSSAVKTSEVVAGLISASEQVLARLLAAGGAISSQARVARFAVGIRAVSERAQVDDAESVAHWVTDVAAVLREDVA